jgi:Na+/proline symporter
MTGLVVAIIGMSLIVGLPLGNDSGRLAGYYLTQASPTPFVAFLSLISSNVAGYTKKTTVAALYLIGYWYVSPSRTLRCLAWISLTIFLQRRQHHRSPNLPSIGRTSLRARRDHYHRVLGRVSYRHAVHLLLLQTAERQEGCVEG